MGKWKRTLNLIDLYEAYDEEEDPLVFALGISARIKEFIKKNLGFVNAEGIKDELEELSEQFFYDTEVEEVDGHLSDLFNLADSYRIWVATF